MKQEVTIRFARPEDNAPIAKMIFDVLKEYDVPADPQGDDLDATEFGLNGTRIYIVAEKDGVPIGSAILTPSEGKSYKLSKLFLAFENRKQGIGRLLLEAAVSTAQNAGGESIYLRTRDKYAEATKLYDSCGWKRDSRSLPPPGPPIKYSLSLITPAEKAGE